jgi:hypothetical protein
MVSLQRHLATTTLPGLSLFRVLLTHLEAKRRPALQDTPVT